MAEMIALVCPGCGAPAATGDKNCKFCGRPVLVKTMRDLSDIVGPDLRKYAAAYLAVNQANPLSSDSALALGICQLKLGEYVFAKDTFTKLVAQDPTNHEALYYLAISLLSGKKAFLAPVAEIRQAESHLETAVQLTGSGPYYLLLSYIAYDYYERKLLNRIPHYGELLELAKEAGCTFEDASVLKETLQVKVFGFPTGDFE